MPAEKDISAFYKSVLDAVHDGLWVTDADDRIIYYNRSMAAIAGVAETDAIGLRITHDFRPETTGQLLPHYHHARGELKPVSYEVGAVLLDGRQAILSGLLTPRVIEGCYAGMICTVQDVTEQQAALHTLRQREQEAVTAGKVGLWDWDLDTNKVVFSDEWKRQIGYLPHEIGDDFEEFRSRIHPEDLDRVLAAAHLCISEGLDNYRIEFRFRHQNGSYCWIIAHGSVLADECGKAVRMLGTHVDITERKVAEQNYQMLFSQMLDGFAVHEIICDSEGAPVDYRFLAVNPAFERQTGLRGRDILGRTVLEVLPKTERHWIDNYGKVALNGEPASFEHYAGEFNRYFLVTAFRPAPGQFACVFMDITDRKQAEEELRRSEERLRGMFEGAHDGIAVADAESRHFLMVNPQMAALTGYAEEELLHLVVEDLHPAASRPEVVEQFVRHVQGEVLTSKDIPVLRQDGTIAYCDINAILAMIAGKQCLIGIFRDVTERRIARARHLAMEAQLRQSQRLESVGTLASGVAHEINNPIFGIMNYAELIKDVLPEGSPEAGYCAEIVHETERIATIVRNLLNFSRNERYSHSLARIEDIIDATMSLIRTIMRHDQIDLRVSLPDDLPDVNCCGQQIQQVLMNLLTNARDALNLRFPGFDEDKIIILTAEVYEEEGRHWLRTTVEDHGKGISPKIRDRIFDPFFTTKDRAKGTGLGLSISHGIIEDHNGRLTCECVPDHHTRFYLDLPFGTDL